MFFIYKKHGVWRSFEKFTFLLFKLIFTIILYSSFLDKDFNRYERQYELTVGQLQYNNYVNPATTEDLVNLFYLRKSYFLFYINARLMFLMCFCKISVLFLINKCAVILRVIRRLKCQICSWLLASAPTMAGPRVNTATT